METKIKQETLLEVVIGERKYRLYLNADSPLGEAHDAVMAIKGFLVERMVQEHKAEQAAQEQQKKIDKAEEEDGSDS